MQKFIIIIIVIYHHQNCAFSLLKLVHAVLTSPDGSTTLHQKDANNLFTVDAKEM